MPVIYEVRIDSTDNPKSYSIHWHNLAAQSQNAFTQFDHAPTPDEVQRLWLKPEHHHALGQKLFRFLDGDARHLQRALTEAADHGEPLILQLWPCKEAADWPFELLAQDSSFLLPTRMHLLRQVSDWGAKKTRQPANRPLKLLFMACSALDVEPELDFEREEETIFRVTEKSAIDMEVEDSGALAGLRERLEAEAYDVVHLSGHADIDRQGQPFFIMETETGRAQHVTPRDLWHEALIENPPAVLFLSGCRTGETPAEQAAISFAHYMVEEFKVPAVLSWGRSVADHQATVAEQFIYHELSRGCDLLLAVQRARHELLEHFRRQPHQAWPLLRLYTSGMMPVALVQSGQELRPKPRKMVHTFLKNSQVKILETGFVGRRRQIQQSLRALQDAQDKIGLLLHGTGGLGKSCLAGKLCERFSDHTLIIVHGRLNAITVRKALDEAFIIANDEAARQILQAEKEMPEKLAQLCATCFKEKNYLFVLDDFEQNLEGAETGVPGPLLAETVPILQTLLHYLPLTGKMTQLLITSRYDFTLTENERDLVADRLEKVPLHSFQTAEQQKKAHELSNISDLLYSWKSKTQDLGKQLLAAGHGNPRLMEWLNQLVGNMPQAEVPDLLAAVRDKQEEFIRQQVIRELLHRSGEQVEKFLRCFSVFRLPVDAQGAETVAKSVLGAEVNWQHALHEGVRLSLIEHDQARQTYWLTPLVRDELCAGLTAEERRTCHQAAFAYYEGIWNKNDGLDATSTEEWIYYALGCGREEVATREGAKLINFLCENLAYVEAKRIGEWVLTEKQQPMTDSEDAFFLNEFARILDNLGEHKQAIVYYEKALEIDRNVYGENHQHVATNLNNLGEAWRALDGQHKAIAYYEQALTFLKQGEQHPFIASVLNNLGVAWRELGEYQRAISYHEQALAIDRVAYGDNYPNVAVDLNNLGSAWLDLGEHQKAIVYLEQALEVCCNVYQEKKHPYVAAVLNNLGLVCQDFGDHQKAIAYLERALIIMKEVYGKQHPRVAFNLNNLGLAWKGVGEFQKAIGYFEQALAIGLFVFGDKHSAVAIWLSNLCDAWRELGDYQTAISYGESALAIHRAVYGGNHFTVATDLANLGVAYNDCGEHKKAISYHEQALVILKQVYGEQHPQVAIILNNLGEAWRVLGESSKAIGYYEQALAILKKVYGEQDTHIASSLNNLGLAWKVQGEYKRAIDYHEQALTIDRAVYGDSHPSLARDLNNLGSVWNDLGEHKKAIGYYEQALTINRTVYSDNHPDVAIDLNNLGSAWDDLGEHKKAIGYYEHALTIDRAVYGENHPKVAIRLNNLGSAYFALGEKEKAKQCFQASYEIKKRFFDPEHPSVKTTLSWLAKFE